MLMPVAERVLLARVTGPFARCPSSQGTIHGASRAPIHAARRDVRLVERGGRGEERSRDTRAIVGRALGQFFFMLVHSYLGTPLGSGSDLGRFGHVWLMFYCVV